MLRIIISLILLSLSCEMYSQQLPFRNYTTRDGLMSNVCYFFFQDREGYLWTSTEAGLSRFDGKHFTNYDKAIDGKPIGLGISFAQTIDGTLWVGGNGNGLLKFDGEKFQRFLISDLPRSNYVTALLESEPNTLLIGTEAGLYKMRENKIEPLIRDAKLMRTYKFSAAGSLFKDTDGLIWALFDGQLRSINPSNGMILDSISHFDSKDHFDWATLLSDGRFVVGCVGNQRVYVFKNHKVEHTILLRDCVNGFAVEDSEGYLWIATNKGLLKTTLANPSAENAEWITTENGLPSSIVASIFPDRERNLWFASYGKGIYKLEETQTYRFNYPFAAGLGCVDDKEQLWFSTPDGLRVIGRQITGNNLGNWQEQHLNPFPDKYFKSMGAVRIFDKDQIWLGCNDGTLVNFTIVDVPGKNIKLNYRRELNSRNGFPKAMSIWIFRDSKNRLWYAENNAPNLHVVDISREHPVLIKTIPFDPGTRLSNRREITEDEDGNFWFAYETNKVVVIDSQLNIKETIENISGNKDDDINCLHKDKDGSMWFGTSTQGLICKTKSGKIIKLNKSNGFLSDRIIQIEEDNNKTLWISTWHGLAFIHYNGDSIQLDENREVTQSPIWSLGIFEDGSGWVATNFEVVFHKRRDTRQAFYPPAVLHKLLINGKESPFQDNLKLSSEENDLVFEYGSICLQSRNAIRFSYKLVGSRNENWSTPSTLEYVNYAGLKPGVYTFLIKALTTDGLESIKPAAFSFTIVPPLWQQAWFLIIIALSIITLIWFLVNLRIKRLVEIERLRGRIAADLHDDIGSGLTRIALASDMLLRQKNETPEIKKESLYNRIGTTARELVEAMSDIVWAIDPKNDSLDRVANLIRLFANEVCEAKDIHCHFKFDDHSVKSLKPGSDIVISIILIAKEAINNVIRHSNCKNLFIEIRANEKSIELTIKDDGVGFDEKLLSRVNGLTNMRRRAEKAKGKLNLNAQPGKGTEIRLIVWVK